MAKITTTLSDSQKKYLREKAIRGAANYAHYLVDKDFLILCRDGAEYTVQFLRSDFRHLTGIDVNISDEDFFTACYERMFDIGNIKTNQRYNWKTLKSKASRISVIHRILFDNVQGALFMINLHTHTKDYPVAIKNLNTKTCIGFADVNNKAKTLRKYISSNRADEQKEISAIFSKKKTDKLYDSMIYVSTVKGVYCKNKNIITKLSDNIQTKFLEILTKPE